MTDKPAEFQAARFFRAVAVRWQPDGTLPHVPEAQLAELVAAPAPNKALRIEHDSKILAA